MALTNKAGWLYFLGETDFKTGESFGYVKIGKTDHDRPVAARMNDHQTGNPRDIIEVVPSIRTHFIDDLETYMHHRFATKRVHGEWFHLDQAELDEVVEEAIRVNELLNTVQPEASELIDLKDVESNGKLVEPTPQNKSDYENFIKFEKERVLCKLNQDICTVKLRALTLDNGGIEDISTHSTVNRNPTFDKDSFTKAHPEITEKYMVTETKLSRGYKITGKPTAVNAFATTNEQCKAAKAKLPEVKSVKESMVNRSATVETLHKEWLELHEAESKARIEAEIYSLKLQHSCGVNEGIEGICAWKRIMKESTRLDATALKNAESNLYESFLVPQSSINRFKVTDYRAY